MATAPSFRDLAERIVGTRDALGLTNTETEEYLTAIQQVMAVGAPADLVTALATIHARHPIDPAALERLARPLVTIPGIPHPIRLHTTAKETMTTNDDLFIASNGVEIRYDEYGILSVTTDEETSRQSRVAAHTARQEFYRSLEDTRLGRWRDRENPDLVIYQILDDPNMVTVLNETTGATSNHPRGTPFQSVHALAARRWFAPHPEPKPWDDAQEGDIWALKRRGEIYRAYYAAARESGPLFSCPSGDGYRSYLASEFTDGHKIWPTDD